MKYVRNPADNTVVESGDDTFLGNMVDGLTASFMGENDLIGRTPALWAQLSGATVGVGIGGFFGRKRAEAGKKPIAGFIL